MGLLTKIPALARRHKPHVWLLWAVGAITLIAVGLTVADPVIWLFVLDPELLALIAMIALTSARGAVRDAVLHVRIAVRAVLTRDRARDHRTRHGRRARRSQGTSSAGNNRNPVEYLQQHAPRVGRDMRGDMQ